MLKKNSHQCVPKCVIAKQQYKVKIEYIHNMNIKTLGFSIVLIDLRKLYKGIWWAFDREAIIYKKYKHYSLI